MSIETTIQQHIDAHPILLFMKGTRDFPQCGFSGRVVSILREINVNFKDVNVLLEPGIREGIKVFSNWPTIPQLYVRGEFIGGCDIVCEMHESGELTQLFAS